VVNPSEPVSRFLLKGDVRPDGKTIKYSAFMPPPNLRLSVFLVSNLSDQQVWELAVKNVEPVRGPVIGRGNLSVSQVVARRLNVSPDVDPASKHANVVNWPEDRDERATIAKELAADAYPAKMRH
jgi:hypothetical protein